MSEAQEEEAVDRPFNYQARIATWSLLVLEVEVVTRLMAFILLMWVEEEEASLA
jgi:hypothetical protein